MSEEDDRRRFEEEMRGVRPLADRARVVPPGPAPRAPRPRVASGPVADPGGPSPPEWRARGVTQDRIRALRRGDVAPDATLDLHGRTRASALPALAGFLRAVRARGGRCVLVVHGRGAHSGDDGAVLRDAVRRALAGTAEVLAFCPAPARLGGDGACLILLRR